MNDPTISKDDPITPSHIPLWQSLRADPHHNYCVYDLKGIPKPGRCVMRLRDFPEDVPAYVHSKIGRIDPYDWWWTRGGTEDVPWIEISIRSQAVIQIESERFTLKELALFKTVDDLIRPFGKVVGYGPEAVGVLGDDRSVGGSIVIRFAEGADAAELSTLIINRVRGITRVLMDI